MRFNKKAVEKAVDSLARLFLKGGGWVGVPEVIDLFVELRKSQSDLDRQVKEAVESLEKTSSLIATLEEAVRERTQKLQQLRADSEHYSRLAQVGAEQAEAFLREVESRLRKGAVTERWVAIAMHVGFGLVFFAGGIWLSEPFKALVEVMWKKLTQ